MVKLVFLLALPIWPIHKAIANAKTGKLRRINARLRSIAGTGDEATRLAVLNPLLIYRREIAAVSEWPFNTDVGTARVLSGR